MTDHVDFEMTYIGWNLGATRVERNTYKGDIEILELKIDDVDILKELDKLEDIKSPALAIKTRLHSIVNYPAYKNAERVEPRKDYMVEILEMANEILEILEPQSSTPTAKAEVK